MFENPGISIDDLPHVQDADYHAHPLRYRTLRIVMRSIIFVVLAVIPVALFIAGENRIAWILLTGWIILYLITIILVLREFPKRAYALRDKDITYRKGWIFYSLTSVPFSRIQHSEINQGPVDRAFKLSTLKIYTAGGSSSDLAIPGLPEDEAVRLREFISNRTADDK